MATTKYADLITRIALADRMVRMDLATIALETVTEEGQARLDVEERLCMPLAGFLRTYQEMSRLVENLKEQGVIQSVDQAAQEGGEKAITGDGGDKKKDTKDDKKDAKKDKS